MKRPGFMEGVGVALGASVAVEVLFSTLATLFAEGFALRLLIAVMGLFYLFYLLYRSGEKVGLITSITVWLIAAAVIWLAGLSLPLYLLLHLGLVWLIRSLYFYSSLISALLDFSLVGLGLASAVWAVSHTGTLFLGVWCLFLVQALFVFIPNSWKRSTHRKMVANSTETRFQSAYEVAEAALIKLSRVG